MHILVRAVSPVQVLRRRFRTSLASYHLVPADTRTTCRVPNIHCVYVLSVVKVPYSNIDRLLDELLDADGRTWSSLVTLMLHCM